MTEEPEAVPGLQSGSRPKASDEVGQGRSRARGIKGGNKTALAQIAGSDLRQTKKTERLRHRPAL